MEQFWEILIEHIYEICIGAGVILSTILNKPKTAEKLKELRNKKIAAKEKKERKLLQKLKDNATQIDKLKEEQ